MNIMIQQSGKNILEPACGLAGRIRLAMQAGSDSHVILYSDNPEQERDEWIAVLDLLQGSANGKPVVVAATPYPTVAWQEWMTALGFDHLWVSAERLDGRRDSDQIQFFALENGLCPLLHIRSDPSSGQRAASVCGACEDRMVLAIHHLRRWCMAEPNVCPWKSGERSLHANDPWVGGETKV
ncbi:MAG: hypothetical protein HQL99_12975 [Magnetococcales bacterium]|nr:hypothetical protein [Magnetococcales bacterium]